MRALLIILTTLAVLTRAAAADDPVAQFRLGAGGRPHVGVPFQLELIVEGFDESPTPDIPKLAIADATVTPLGATPNVSRSMQIVNGRRTDSTRVTWSLRWRVEVSKAGQLRVPSTTVIQGSKRATAAAGEVPVETVPSTDTMKISLDLPTRAVFVGETIPVQLIWLFQNQPQDQTFAVPLLASDAFTVSAPPVTNPRRALTLSAGAKDLQLPYTIDQTTVNGVEFNRLTINLFVAPRSLPAGPAGGKVEIAPASVVAALPVGRADFFGNAPTQTFRASDVPRTLTVKPLPETDRPPTFSGAVGEQFSIAVKTSRSVVSLGEPVELDVTIKSNQPLDNLSLGKLDGDGRLPKDKFTVPAEAPTGELTDEGKTKTFKITAQVTGPATEVPGLSFSYFDPTKEQYRTIRSEPIALSVKGGSFVGAGDVVSATPTKKSPTAATDDPAAVGNVELALSSIGAADERPIGGTVLWVLIGLLYAIPLALLGARSWQLRTRGQREEAAEVRAARKKVEQLLDKGATVPARDVAGPLGAALRDLARVLGRDVDDHGLIAKLETEAFAPESSGKPLSPDLRSDAAGLLRRWLGDARKAPSRRTAAATAIVLLALGAHDARAASLDDGRAAYQEAMELTSNATSRKAAFARAEIALGEAARSTPDRPELLADWGNAALGAGDVATAVLAYRRALALDAGNPRARQNLAWLRSRQPDAFRPAIRTGATDTLLFFHHWPTARKMIVGAAAFAVAILMLVPWAGRRRRALTGLSVVPFAIWIAMIASVVLEDRHADDGVVMDDVVMRAADSAGAPAALSQALPRGTEVMLLERRDAWTRIRVANGTSGWVPGGAVERITP